MNKQGYTLMEVSLFLVISGLLTLVAIVGIGPRLTNVRFSTGVRDIQNNITKELSTTALGNNTNTKNISCVNGTITASPSSVGGGTNDNCVLSGRVAIFGPSQIVYRDIVATTQSVGSGSCLASAPGSFDHVTKCFRPHILPNSIQQPSTYTPPSGITQTYPSPSQSQAFGYIKSPEDNTTFRFYITGGVSWNLPMDHPWIANYTHVTSEPFPVCFKLSNRTAKLTFSSSTPDSKLEINGTCP